MAAYPAGMDGERLGRLDLLRAVYEGNRIGLEAGQLGATYFIINSVGVPLLLITHGLMIALLLQRDPGTLLADG